MSMYILVNINLDLMVDIDRAGPHDAYAHVTYPSDPALHP